MFFTSLRIVQNWLFLTPQSSLGWSPLDVFPPKNGHIVLCIHKLRSLGLNPRCCKCLCGLCLLLPYSSNEHFFFFLFLPTVGVVRPHLPALLLGRLIKSQVPFFILTELPGLCPAHGWSGDSQRCQRLHTAFGPLPAPGF